MNSSLAPTTRCCGWPGHRPTDIFGVCSPPSRRVAALRPPLRGAFGLDGGSAHACPDRHAIGRCPTLTPLHVVVDDLSSICRFSMSVDTILDRQPCLRQRLAECRLRAMRTGTGAASRRASPRHPEHTQRTSGGGQFRLGRPHCGESLMREIEVGDAFIGVVAQAPFESRSFSGVQNAFCTLQPLVFEDGRRTTPKRLPELRSRLVDAGRQRPSFRSTRAPGVVHRGTGAGTHGGRPREALVAGQTDQRDAVHERDGGDPARFVAGTSSSKTTSSAQGRAPQIIRRAPPRWCAGATISTVLCPRVPKGPTTLAISSSASPRRGRVVRCSVFRRPNSTGCATPGNASSRQMSLAIPRHGIAVTTPPFAVTS